MRKILIGVLVLAVLGAVGFGVVRFQQQKNAAEMVYEILRSADVQREALEISVTASGNVAVNERTDLLIRMPGTVADVTVEPNDRVKAGDVLVSMDTDDLERSLRQSEIALQLVQINLETAAEDADAEDIRVAELALSSAGKALEVARLGTETARVDADAIRVQAQRAREQAYIKLRDIRDKKQNEEDALIAYTEAEAEERAADLNATATTQQAQSQLQAAQLAYKQAERTLEALREGPDADIVQQQELQVEQAQLRLEQVRRNLEDAALTAPYDGLVAAVAVEAGTYQSAGKRAVTLIDDSRYYVDVTIDEIDIGAIGVGQNVEVILDAYPDAILTGVVETVAPAATNVGGLVAYRVRVELAGTEETRVIEGMTASVKIATETIPDVLLAPSWALRIDQESALVYTYVLDETGTPERRSVEVGRRNEDFTEILSGVAAGDTVALVLEERVPFNFFAAGGPPGRN